MDSDKWDYSAPRVEDMEKLQYLTRATVGVQDLEWFKANYSGLPDALFEQLEKVESGEITKKMVKNIHKKFLRKHKKQCHRKVVKYS